MAIETQVQLLEMELPDNDPFNSYSFKEKTVLGPLSLINLFIGPNNSGKSRLIRNIL